MRYNRTLSSGFTVLSLSLFAASASAAPVAFDLVNSTSLNVLSYTNPWTNAFASGGDGFQIYQRGVSGSIPFSVLDDSLISFPTDTLGIIDDNNTDAFFGATDTQNADNNGPVSATWVFDVSGFSNLRLSIDMGAMGDFEGSDSFEFTYSLDGGATTTAFSSSVDEAGSLEYTLAGGAMVTLADPLSMEGLVLSNVLQTLSTGIAGDGDELTLTFTAMTDGGSEAFAFQNVVISSVPVPAAVWLLGSAVALLGLRRRA